MVFPFPLCLSRNPILDQGTPETVGPTAWSNFYFLEFVEVFFLLKCALELCPGREFISQF